MDDDKIFENGENQQSNNPKIVVVSGDGKDLDISEVHNHLNIEIPDSSESRDKKIVIPPDPPNE